jgi:hypothetical protein
MNLTREEQLMVASMVVESHGVSISEAKSNQQLKEDLKLNLEFYSSIKEDIISEGEGMLDSVLYFLGNVKDLWTAATKADNFFGLIAKKLQTAAGKYASKISKYIPSSVKDLGSKVKQFAEWLYKTLGYQGFAKLFARLKYRAWRRKPTDEQIKCMVPFAKLVVTILYIVLVAAFLIKVLSTILAGKVVVAATGTQMASISGPLTSLFAALGKGSAAKGMFSVFSAALKVKDAQKYAKEAQAKIDDSKEATMKSLFTNFKPAWNTCAVPTKEVKLTLEQRIDNIY